jgi:acid phosphatase
LFRAALLAFSLIATVSPVGEAAPSLSGASAAGDASPLARVYNIQHVFLIVMENRGYTQVWDRNATPYITALGKRYARAANYHALTHPSLPNYLKMYAGSSYGINRNCIPAPDCHISAVHLADHLGARGLRWKGYMESMPAPCTLVNTGKYAPRHNPFIYFDDIRTNPKRCRQRVVPLTALPVDLTWRATTPNFAMIVPDVCNDMHNCSIGRGDRWLKAQLPAILYSPACHVDKCLIVLTWDEDNGHEHNRVLTIFAGSAARLGFVSSTGYNHYSLLRTIENIFGLPTQTKNDAAARPMDDMLR